MQTARAYFDGKEIRFHDPLPIKKDDELLVTVLSGEDSEESLEEYQAACANDLGEEDYLSEDELRYYFALEQ